jgi:hypothetical protein
VPYIKITNGKTVVNARNGFTIKTLNAYRGIRATIAGTRAGLCFGGTILTTKVYQFPGTLCSFREQTLNP